MKAKQTDQEEIGRIKLTDTREEGGGSSTQRAAKQISKLHT